MHSDLELQFYKYPLLTPARILPDRWNNYPILLPCFQEKFVQGFGTLAGGTSQQRELAATLFSLENRLVTVRNVVAAR